MSTSLTASAPAFHGIASTWKGKDGINGKLRWCWQYLDRDCAAVLGIVARYDYPSGAKEVIPFFQPDGHNGWKQGHRKGIRRPLFGLHTLHLPGAVFVCEGEKDTTALHELGLAAVTSPGGCQQAHYADWTVLSEFRRIVIWPDADAAGAKYGDKVVAIMAQLPGSRAVLRVNPDGLSLKDREGAADWLMQHTKGWDGFTSINREPGDDVESELLEAVQAHSLPVKLDSLIFNKASATTGVNCIAQKCSWPAPIRLPERPLVDPFDPDLLPAPLRPWIGDIAERTQIPMDYAGVAAIVALGAVIGRQCTIRPKQYDDWMEVPNLWGCIVGNPGTLKSPALRAAQAPLLRLQADAFEEHKKAEVTAKANAHLLKAQRHVAQDGLKKAIKGASTKHDSASRTPEEIAKELAALDEHEQVATCRRWMTNDCTVEKLGELLMENPNGLYVFRDELAGFLRGLEKQGHESDRAFYLESWSGHGQFTYDRIGRGTVHIPAACVSVFGSIQPGPLAAYLRENQSGSGADGFVSRFQLAVWPDAPAVWVNIDRWPDTEAKNLAFEVFERCAALDTCQVGAEVEGDSLPFLHFDDEAQAMFNDWHTGLRRRLRGEELHPAMVEHLSKYSGLIPSLALIIHLAEGYSGKVTAASLAKALRWAKYLESHARRIYGAVTGEDCETARHLLRKIQSGALSTPFTQPEVQQKNWTGMGDVKRVVQTLELLETYGYLRREEKKTGGRPSVLWHIHPDYAGENAE